jgi:hypothetical protein
MLAEGGKRSLWTARINPRRDKRVCPAELSRSKRRSARCSRTSSVEIAQEIFLLNESDRVAQLSTRRGHEASEEMAVERFYEMDSNVLFTERKANEKSSRLQRASRTVGSN